MGFFIPFALGWAGGYIAWKAIDPSCRVGKGYGLSGMTRKNRAARRARR